MKNLKVITAGLALIAGQVPAWAQNETDALRYSQSTFGGTARIQGITGAQAALGADASTVALNPAGLGLYRKSEFTFSPAINFNETESLLNGINTPDSRSNFNISQMGFVFTDRKADEVEGDWRGGSFGIGFTRLNNFHTHISYAGVTTDKNSLLQNLEEKVTPYGTSGSQILDLEYGTNGNNITTIQGLAWATYLIDTLPNGNGAVYVPARQGQVQQRESIFSDGAQNQWDFSYGASYKDKLFIGGSLGLMTVKYEQQRTYSEVSAPEEPYLNNFVLNDYFRTTGSGINAKVGLLYKPVDAFRVGATIQTPTYMWLYDTYTTNMTAVYKSGASYYAQTLDGTFDYNLTTPFRANAGLAYFIGKYGFISADIEYLDYGDANFSISDGNPYGLPAGTGYFQEQNRVIDNSYSSAINYRVGAEARFDIFRIRGGFALYGDPYKSSNLDRDRTFFTGGIGIKEKKFFVDAAYIYSKFNSYYSPYTLNDNSQPVVSTKNTNANFVVTAGFTF